MSSDASPPESGAIPKAPGGLRAFVSGRTGIALMVILAVGLVAATAFALVGGSKPAVRVPDPRTVPVGTYFGVHTKIEQWPRTPELFQAATEDLEARLGRKLDMTHYFYPWEKEFPTEIERWDLRHGRIPMISWNGRDAYASDIAAGRHDPLIMDRAIRVKELGAPVMIRWFWEMDGNKKAEWAQSPADYVAAWRRIVDVFDDQGANNVAWVWCPNASAFRDGRAQEFYPGHDYVHWICGDGYNWAPGRERDRWRSFHEIFDGFYDWASKQGKPIMVGEFGAQERAPGEKAAWLADAQATIKRDFPLIKAVVYFNANQDYDWRIDTSPASFEAFRRWANDPWFNTSLDRLVPKP